jgi:AhpD family alkylhydroperoxidase
MSTSARTLAGGILACVVGLSATAQAPERSTSPPGGAQPAERAASGGADVTAAHEDMKRTIGLVPGFIKQLPPAAVPGLWQEWKALELNPNTAIPPKYKSLIGLGVGAQVPCSFCVYFDTQGARAAGASQQEISEGVTMAAITRKWSTILNGVMQDEAAFRKEAADIFAHARQRRPPSTIKVTDAASAQKDIEQTLGAVPTFMRRYPPAGLPGAWLEFKNIQLNPNTAVPAKYKELIGLGVAAQIPCRYCVHFHAEAAKANGASQAELDEALAIAALLRHWSTFISGIQYDERVFRREVDSIFRHLKSRPASASAPELAPGARPAVR